MKNSLPACTTHRSTSPFKRGYQRAPRFFRWGVSLAGLFFLTLGARDFRAQQPPPPLLNRSLSSLNRAQPQPNPSHS